MAVENVKLKDLLEGKEISQLSFEQGLKLLEELVQGVETGNLPLEKAVLSYEKGVQLVAHLRGLLSGAEEKLRLLQKPQ